VLSNAFGVDAIAVDTHVFRVANRIGLVKTDTPEKTEFELMRVLPKKRWSLAHHLIIFHGRRMCKARKPECGICPLTAFCDYYQEGKE
ncbi:MAG: endonuclease III, partial [Clostridiales bacterium]|nr:endonuclease III [Clostridiales bacterium]